MTQRARILSPFWAGGGTLTDQAWRERDDNDDSSDDTPVPSMDELAAWAALPVELLRVAEYQTYGSALSAPIESDHKRRREQPMASSDSSPAWLAGEEPRDTWTSDQLAAYVAHHEQRLPAYSPESLIDWDTLDVDQLRALARCRTEPEAQRLMDHFRAGGSIATAPVPPKPRRRTKVKQRSTS